MKARQGAAIVEARGVSKRFAKTTDIAGKAARYIFGTHTADQGVQALDRVDLSVNEGELLGLVGESGCGKSTFGRIVAGILPPSEGAIMYRGRDMTELDRSEAKKAKLAIQMIFQDAFSSLNPRMRVGEIVGEAAAYHQIVQREVLDDYVVQLFRRVGLDPADKDRYPHQFSGGQRQRIGIARALAVKPEFLVCDEAVSALDVSIQAQILNLFLKLREEFQLTYLFISHDLGVVRHLSDRVAIMYLGRIVETAATDQLFVSPHHPYTQALIEQVPRLDARRQAFAPLKGELPSPLDPPTGCHFHPRCPLAIERCKREVPPFRKVAQGHWSACIRDG